MEPLILQKEFTAKFNISACRAAIRKLWHFQGVIRNEINENCFELKNIGIRQVLTVGFLQYVTILLTEKDEDTTIIQIQTTPFGTVNNNEYVWQTKMEELVGIMWRELCQELETPSQQATIDIQNTSERPAERSNKNKKIWIGCIVAAVILIVLIIDVISNLGFGNKTYVYASDFWRIEMELQDGYDKGNYKLKIINQGTGYTNEYTGMYWTHNSTHNGWENYAITGYTYYQFDVATDRSKLIIQTTSGIFTLSLQ